MTSQQPDLFDQGDPDTEIVVQQGRTRRANFAIVYHELIDLYAPMICFNGIGFWLFLKRHVNNQPDHILKGKAWPGQRLAKQLFRVSSETIKEATQILRDADLLDVVSGAELDRRYCEHIAKCRPGPNPGIPIDLIAKHIRNPHATFFYTVHDPLEFEDFLKHFQMRAACPIKGKWTLTDQNGQSYPAQLSAQVRRALDKEILDELVRQDKTTRRTKRRLAESKAGHRLTRKARREKIPVEYLLPRGF